MKPPAADLSSPDLLAELPDCVLVLDEHGQVHWGNRAAERLFGRSLRDSIGFPALDLVHPDDLEFVLRSLASVQRKEIGTLIEVRAKTATGWRLLEVIGAPVSWPDEPSAVLFCMRDITERRRFEVARNDDARFRSVVQNSPDMTILLTPSGTVESTSGALSRILGHDPEEVEGQRLVDLVIEDDRPEFLASLHLAAQDATALNPVTVRVQLHHHGSRVPTPVEMLFVNLLDDPTVGRLVISARDITAQVAAEKDLYENEQKFRKIFTQGPLGICLTDLQQQITDANGAFCAFVDHPLKDVVGATFSVFIHPNDRERDHRILRLLEGQASQTQTADIQFLSDRMEGAFGNVTTTLVLDDQGEPIYCLRIVEDITKRKMLERELVAHASTASKLLASLTARETEILELLDKVATASAIADRLSVSVRTVESHLENAYRKLGVHTRGAAIAEFGRLTRAVTGLPHEREHPPA